jgi:hypothetical protein
LTLVNISIDSLVKKQASLFNYLSKKLNQKIMSLN